MKQLEFHLDYNPTSESIMVWSNISVPLCFSHDKIHTNLTMFLNMKRADTGEYN